MRSVLAVLLVLLSTRADAAEDPVWVRLDAPAAEAVETSPAALLEVRGRAGIGPRRDHDVVLAIDLSGSTLMASGVDVDGDGETGRVSGRVRNMLRRNIQPVRLADRHWSSDPGDSIRAALAVAARRLIDELDPVRTRIGLLEFGEAATPLAPLGSSRSRLEAGIAVVEQSFGRGGGTNFEAAVRTGTRMLGASDDGSRTRSLLLLSDGMPTLPAPETLARERAQRAASDAGARGIRIHTFALGQSEDVEAAEAFAEMAAVTGGTATRTQRPGDVIVELPRAKLAGVEEVALENLTTGEPGRAVRSFADGSFDGFVVLVEGENRIRVGIRTTDGDEAAVEQSVRFAPRQPADAGEARALERELASQLETLRARTAETALQREIDAARRAAQERLIELEPDRDDDGS